MNADLVLNIGSSSAPSSSTTTSSKSSVIPSLSKSSTFGSSEGSVPPRKRKQSSTQSSRGQQKKVNVNSGTSDSPNPEEQIKWSSGESLLDFLNKEEEEAARARKEEKEAQKKRLLEESAASSASGAAGQNRRPDHIESFSELGITCDGIHFALSQPALSISDPTPIQRALIPKAVEGRHVLATATTGTGKTFSFVIPIVQRLFSNTPIDKRDRSLGTRVLIIVPTRELAAQTAEQFTLLTMPHQDTRWLVAGALCGGTKPKSEKLRLKKGLPVLIATPGRLLYHLKNTSAFSTAALSHVVLDEADRLADAGFKNDVLDCLSRCAAGAKSNSSATAVSSAADAIQLICVSATGSSTTPFAKRCVKALNSNRAKSIDSDIDIELIHATDATQKQGQKQKQKTTLAEQQQQQQQQKKLVSGGSRNEQEETVTGHIEAPRSLCQFFLLVPRSLRLSLLVSLLRGSLSRKKVIVFFSSIDSVEFHHRLFTDYMPLESNHDHILILHGDKPQAERTKQVELFSKARGPSLLLCTDVAARGLHLPAIDWVVHYDPPSLSDDYVHRSGRTARMGIIGHSLLFLAPQEAGFVDFLEAKKLQSTARPKRLALSSIARQDDVEQGKRVIIDAVNEKRRRVTKTKKRRRGPGAETTGEAHAPEEFISFENDDTLLKLARAAFLSFCRAYRTHERETRDFFDAKKLALGQVAASFGLNDVPSEIANKLIDRKAMKAVKEKEQAKQRVVDQKLQQKQNQMSEFVSGLF